jgi:hypothetical protein
MVHPQVVYEGTPSNMESYQDVEYTVMDSQQGEDFQPGGWVRSKQLVSIKIYHALNQSQMPWTWTDLSYDENNGKGT